MVESITNGHPRSVVNGIVVQCLTKANIILWLDAMAEQESEKVKELHFHIEGEVHSLAANLLETKSVLRLNIHISSRIHSWSQYLLSKIIYLLQTKYQKVVCQDVHPKR